MERQCAIRLAMALWRTEQRLNISANFVTFNWSNMAGPLCSHQNRRIFVHPSINFNYSLGLVTKETMTKLYCNCSPNLTFMISLYAFEPFFVTNMGDDVILWRNTRSKSEGIWLRKNFEENLYLLLSCDYNGFMFLPFQHTCLNFIALNNQRCTIGDPLNDVTAVSLTVK